MAHGGGPRSSIRPVRSPALQELRGRSRRHTYVQLHLLLPQRTHVAQACALVGPVRADGRDARPASALGARRARQPCLASDDEPPSQQPEQDREHGHDGSDQNRTVARAATDRGSQPELEGDARDRRE